MKRALCAFSATRPTCRATWRGRTATGRGGQLASRHAVCISEFFLIIIGTCKRPRLQERALQGPCRPDGAAISCFAASSPQTSVDRICAGMSASGGDIAPSVFLFGGSRSSYHIQCEYGTLQHSCHHDYCCLSLFPIKWVAASGFIYVAFELGT